MFFSRYKLSILHIDLSETHTALTPVSSQFRTVYLCYFYCIFPNAAPRQTTCLSRLIPEPPIPSLFLKASFYPKWPQTQGAGSSIPHHTLCQPLANFTPMYPPGLLRPTPNNAKTLLSAHRVVYINSLNFICGNLVHHLLGMLYKEDEKSVALEGIVHALSNLNKYGWRNSIWFYICYRRKRRTVVSSEGDLREDERNGEMKLF